MRWFAESERRVGSVFPANHHYQAVAHMGLGNLLLAINKPRDAMAPPQTTREATVDDIDRLESLTLEDFAAEFEKVKIPEKSEGERLTSDELNAAVEGFLDSLRTR